MFVIVSGLPASGKTSVAEPLASALGLRLISKDAIKQALFEAVGWGDWNWSKTVSRAADAAMVRLARDLDGAVLDNFWYRETANELLAALPRPMVEVFCRCPPEVAYERFRQKLPLGTLGPVIEVDTQRPVAIDAVAARVEAAGRG